MSEQAPAKLPSISQVKVRDFINCRARIQRLSDAKAFTGWVEFISDRMVEIRVSATTPVELNETFYVEMVGSECGLGFNAALVGMGGKEVAELIAKMGSSTSSETEPEITLELFPSSAPKVLPLTGDCRRSVGQHPALAINEGIEMECRIVDIAQRGVGILLGVGLERGESIEIRVSAGTNEATIFGKVRYSKELKKGLFRLGILIDPMERIEFHQWRKVNEALAPTS